MERDKSTLYYLCEDRLVKHVRREDKFWLWDEEKSEWVESRSLWHDFYGWGGWGDGIAVFRIIDMEKLFADYCLECGS